MLAVLDISEEIEVDVFWDGDICWNSESGIIVELTLKDRGVWTCSDAEHEGPFWKFEASEDIDEVRLWGLAWSCFFSCW